MKDRAKKLEAIFLDCLYRAEEITDEHRAPEGAVIVQGVVRRYGLHPERVKKHDAEIVELLTDLPEEFYTDKGEGWSFLNLCINADGTEWTGFQSSMEQLCVLAIATGHGRWLLPPELWHSLPNGMPYIQFDRKEK